MSAAGAGAQGAAADHRQEGQAHRGRPSRRRLEGRLRRLRDRHDGLLHGHVAGRRGHQGAARRDLRLLQESEHGAGQIGQAFAGADGPGRRQHQRDQYGRRTGRAPLARARCRPASVRRAVRTLRRKPPRHKADDKQQSPTSVEEARRLTEEADHKKLESLVQELRQAIDMSQALKPFKDQLLLDITPEGLRIQIVDAQNRPMFDLGSAKLKDYTGQILHELAPYLNTVPNRISLSGHTDTTPYVAQQRRDQLGPVGRPRQRRAPRARGRRPVDRQDRAHRRTVLLGAVRQEPIRAIRSIAASASSS